jgi:tetratricopeptide (TPR) repeat protein
MLDKAIAAYERNIAENPRTPAVYTSTVNLARCYMAEGIPPQEHFDKAEKWLLSLVQDNPDLKPTAEEFRVSVFTLGELYYRNGRWADAILRLEEAMTRYPDDKEMPRVTFMLAESYRSSAREVGDALGKDPGIDRRSELAQARIDRLQRAETLFAQVIEKLDVDPAETLAGVEPKLTPLEEEYLRSSYMDRAECAFELGDYASAIKLYDQTATRFAQRAVAIQAYVQIVNCYMMMNQPQQASAAAERGQWVLKRIPDEEFGKGSLALSRGYYEDFLKLTKR